MYRPTTISDLISRLDEVRHIASAVAAWDDNDGEPTLNSFATSGVGGQRSDALLDPIAEAQDAARDALRFTQDGNGRLHQTDRRQLEEAGFQVLAGEPGYTVVAIPPSDEACIAAEHAGEHTPETMQLELTHWPEEELY